jgi:hypothetical protein
MGKKKKKEEEEEYISIEIEFFRIHCTKIFSKRN